MHREGWRNIFIGREFYRYRASRTKKSHSTRVNNPVGDCVKPSWGILSHFGRIGDYGHIILEFSETKTVHVISCTALSDALFVSFVAPHGTVNNKRQRLLRERVYSLILRPWLEFSGG